MSVGVEKIEWIKWLNGWQPDLWDFVNKVVSVVVLSFFHGRVGWCYWDASHTIPTTIKRRFWSCVAFVPVTIFLPHVAHIKNKSPFVCITVKGVVLSFHGWNTTTPFR
jgi:hypothetical protein